MLLKQDHSCGTGGDSGRGRGGEVRKGEAGLGEKNRKKSTGKNSTAAKSALFLCIYIISSPTPIPLLTKYLNLLTRKKNITIIACSHTNLVLQCSNPSPSVRKEKTQNAAELHIFVFSCCCCDRVVASF